MRYNLTYEYGNELKMDQNVVEEIRNDFLKWIVAVYNKVKSPYYPELPFEIQMSILIGNIKNAETYKDFWESFKGLLGYTIYTLVGNEPASPNEDKTDRMDIPVLISILQRASYQEPGLTKIMTTISNGLPESQEEFYDILNKIEQVH